MRASPRTWPSIRRKRLSTEVLALVRMLLIYPLGVCDFKGHDRARAGAAFIGDRSGLRDEGRSCEFAVPPPLCRAAVPLLLGKLRAKIRRTSRKLSPPAQNPAATTGRYHLH